MFTQKTFKTDAAAAATLLALSLISTPANAHGRHDYVAPAAAFIALSWMFHHHGHHHHHHYHHGHHGHHYKRHRRHSHSHGGYHKKRHRIRH